MTLQSPLAGHGDVPVRQYTTKKLIGIPQEASVKEACQVMVEFGISSLVVLDEREEVIGFITQRDIIQRVVSEGQSSLKPVEEFMSRDPITVDIERPVSEVLREMAKHQITHMLLVEDGKVKGIFTLKDYLDFQGQRPSTSISTG
jgi:signal-transduction protein with cAMP-binding, CBS, and nucleotidyltransferase domain